MKVASNQKIPKPNEEDRMIVFEEEKIEKCEFCNSMFPESYTEYHVKECHKRLMVCPICNQLHYSQLMLDDHLLAHQMEEDLLRSLQSNLNQRPAANPQSNQQSR